MKKYFVFLNMLFALNTFAQGKHIFSKDPVINLENFQKAPIHFGFYLGLNSFDYKVDYKTPTQNILIQRTTGFNVGLIANLRLNESFDLRFEPGLYSTKRNISFSGFEKQSQSLREANGTYIHFPLLVKYSAIRTGNIRPYLLAGGSLSLNLSSNEKSESDNAQQVFRVKSWTKNYELGLGIDIFSEYFIFSPSIRGVFGIGDELVRDINTNSPWTSNIESIKNRAVLINITFH